MIKQQKETIPLRVDAILFIIFLIIVEIFKIRNNDVI